MNAQPILDKIEQDAQASARALVADAEAKALDIRKKAQSKLDTMKADMVAQAEREGQEAQQRMLRMADLEDRKSLLAKKRKLLDEAFDLALQKLRGMPQKELRAFFLAQVVQAAQGQEELVVGAEHAAWFDDAFVQEANAALEKRGKMGKLRQGQERRPGITGVILATQGTEVHTTLETLLDALRSDMEAEVATQLFGG